LLKKGVIMSIKLHLMGELITLIGRKTVSIEISKPTSLKEVLRSGLQQGIITTPVFNEIIEGKYMVISDKKQITLEDKVEMFDEIYIIPPIQGG